LTRSARSPSIFRTTPMHERISTIAIIMMITLAGGVRAELR
jgi:hypothetical protein